ncbi:signal peptidase I [Streptomyces sp. MB09-01]|uniref:signal peptidase I n=1 Tax=Streptomyces sp. MB09-01 TaxID=3028666 RepID=UPI0029ACB567|nr:signal peptidase I [Streptomyces sp. MB09-01]MDX3540460.1 signal peptidase I [Streptomyces sp. MB09-01]
MERRRGRRRGIWAIVLLVAGGVLVLGGTVHSAVSAGHSEVDYEKHRIASDHMRPAYAAGDSGWFSMGAAGEELEIGRGDVVLVSVPQWRTGGLMLSRVVARGGDRIEHRRGESTLRLNGEPLEEPYILDRSVPAVVAFDVTVPEGRTFLMGDNRGNSADSSMHISEDGGTVPLSAIRGEAVVEPTDLIVAGGLQFVGAVVFLAGGVLGIVALVVRRREPAPAQPVPGAPAPGATG